MESQTSEAMLTKSALLQRPAHEVVVMLREGTITPLRLIEAVEEAVSRTNPRILATIIPCFDRARRAAAAFRIPESPPPGFLFGLPVLIKDDLPVEGVLWTSGSPLFANRVASGSHAMVRQLEESGAIVVGKTNTPELMAGSQSFNPVWGTTLNPFDTSRTAGGSSGGSAAALAAGQCWLATGSDLGGSLRNPAGKFAKTSSRKLRTSLC